MPCPTLSATGLSACFVIAAHLCAPAARGGDELFGDDLKTPEAERYTIRFEPSVFYASPGGKVLLPGSPGGVGASHLEDLNLDSPRMSPFGELHIRSGDWRVSLSGFAVSLADRGAIASQDGQIGGLNFNTGDRLNSSLDFASGEAVIALELGAPDKINGRKDPAFAVSFEALAGVRFFDVDFQVETPSGTAGGDGFFLQPMIGGKVSIDIGNDVTIDVQADFGGFMDGPDKNSLSTNILAGFMYRPTANLGIQIGYRLFVFDLNEGQGPTRFEYRGAVAGIYAGVVFRF